MKFKEMIDNYLFDSSMYKSKGTYAFDVSHCKILFEYFRDVKSKKISFQKVVDFIKHQQMQGVKNNTINKRVQMLKRIFKFNNEKADFLEIKKLKEDFVTFGKLEKEALEKLNQVVDELKSLKSKLIILLLLDTGCRLNELLNIERENINLDNRSILLTKTKANGQRYVYFSTSTKKLLKKYLQKTIKLNVKWLFYNSKTLNKMEGTSIESMFYRIRKKYNFDKLSPHRLRHTLSSRIYENGADLVFIQLILGHTNLETTKRYIHTDNLHNLKKYDKYNKKNT